MNAFQRSSAPRTLALALAGSFAAGAAPGQVATFARHTDSITFTPACIGVPDQITYEAVIRLNGSQASATGNIYNEILPFWYDRQFGITSTGVYEYTHPVDAGLPWHVPATLTPGVWHHVAYCYDGSEQRFYLDGTMLASRPQAGAIATACGGFPGGGNGAIGRVVRGNGPTYASFFGSLESFRVSSVARYAGASFVPPLGDLASDADTMLLFNFDECESATMADDAGPMSRDGTIGGSGGTRPTFSLECCPADLDDDGVFPGGTPDGGVDINDLLFFLGALDAGDAAADLDDGSVTGTPDGGVDISDLLYFLARFDAGC